MQERIITYFTLNHLSGWALCNPISDDMRVADGKQEEFGRVDALPPQRKRKCESSTQDL
jgi:hypothetical protein